MFDIFYLQMKKFNICVADPPWNFGDSLKKMKAKTKRSAKSQYKTMSASEVAQLEIASLIDPEWAVLVLWVPSTLLKEGLIVMDAWKFAHKQTFVWCKTKKDTSKHEDPNDMLSFGMGRLFRQTHEIALIGSSGKDVYKHLENRSQRSVMFDINKGHSTKPEILQDRLELMFPSANKLEMFARRQRPNWTCIGDAVTGKDIETSIEELKLL